MFEQPRESSSTRQLVSEIPQTDRVRRGREGGGFYVTRLGGVTTLVLNLILVQPGAFGGQAPAQHG